MNKLLWSPCVFIFIYLSACIPQQDVLWAWLHSPMHKATGTACSWKLVGSMPSPVEPNVTTYTCQGQQVIQAHGLHKKRQSAVFKAVHFGLEMKATGEISFSDGHSWEYQIGGSQELEVRNIVKVFLSKWPKSKVSKAQSESGPSIGGATRQQIHSFG
jgi:hypothetical protein